MKPQAAILDPVPSHARHLFLDVNPSAHPRAALHKLAAACDGRSVVLGLGVGVAEALGNLVQGFHAFPGLPLAEPTIPSTQHALWTWLRGDGPGDLLLLGHELRALNRTTASATIETAMKNSTKRPSRPMSSAPRRRISSPRPSWCADRCPGWRASRPGWYSLPSASRSMRVRRMTGDDDGISDALFCFTRPLTGGYYWCPPMAGNGVDRSVLG